MEQRQLDELDDYTEEFIEDETPEEVLRSHILNLTGLLKVMLGELSPEEEAILDEALIQTYAIKDIYPDRDFSDKEPPLMSDLQNVLESMTGAESLVIRIKNSVLAMRP